MRKRILWSMVVLSLCGFSPVVHARDITKGTLQISGDSNASFGRVTNKVEGSKTTEKDSLDVEIEGAYYFVDNVGLGLLAGYKYTDLQYSSSSYDGDAGSSINKNKTKRIGAVLKVSVPVNNVTNLSAGATAGYMSDEIVNYYEADGVFYGGYAGISLFPVQSVSVDISLAYMHESIETDYSPSFSGGDVERDSLHGQIGLSVYF